ncbi:MAG: hypothetical protein GY953_29970, partial [bacterium]|nr:hypothetical protein [bacterium]
MTIQQVTRAVLFPVLSLGLGCGGPAPEAEPEAPASKPLPVKVLRFYASPGAVNAGEEVQICYGVEGADRVEMKPHVRDLKPGSNRCFSFAPKRSTTYTLTARGEGGEDSADLEVRVMA